jgi:hypothetical protein
MADRDARPLQSGAVPRRVVGTRSERLDDELLLYREQGSALVTLNAEASAVWELCDGCRSLAEIEALLAAAFPEAGERIRGDLRTAVAQLVGQGVLEIVEPGRQRPT